VAVVTGPGTPLGRGSALALAASGASVALVGDGAAAGVASEIRSAGGRSACVAGGISSREEAERAFGEVARGLGPPDVLVHAAYPPGAFELRRLEDGDDEWWERIWESGMRAAVACLQAAHRHMSGRDSRIVLVTPTVAMSGAGGMAAGAALAEGERLLAKSAARQWGSEGIRVNCVAASASAAGGAPGGDLALADAALTGGDPVDDIGPAVVFLSSSGSRYLTGATLCLDGGVWMAP
jgi:NAD(P)-dependent dehydrogenase (short-subunit alcohol dehydrogenase family)